jgi:hypothetical protein
LMIWDTLGHQSANRDGTRGKFGENDQRTNGSSGSLLAPAEPLCSPLRFEGVKKLNLSRHPGENRGPGNW